MSAEAIGGTAAPQARQRWLLLGSLALNLFFIGCAVALFMRGHPMGPGPRPQDRSVQMRIERIASELPPPDADKLRAQYKANTDTVERARANYRAAQDVARGVLEREPFDPAALTAAMTQIRAARQNYDQVMQGLIAAAAGEMSQNGRNKLAGVGR